MKHYTECTVVLRFVSDEPITSISHRMQMGSIQDLAEFVQLDRPHETPDAGWAVGHRMMDHSSHLMDLATRTLGYPAKPIALQAEDANLPPQAPHDERP